MGLPSEDNIGVVFGYVLLLIILPVVSKFSGWSVKIRY
ncbi:hypothetical protein B6N60_04245 [Richelia sinica FACHB-800]|uniref:Uncharacterized protein n=1 Tax=Richelia sinica FACHB-800 TaxID=1357546 RepID=A0A975Y6Q3_9NOST|nr:hypothetical protein B6N60_04245 [Richelia sinica FACHB-800]